MRHRSRLLHALAIALLAGCATPPPPAPPLADNGPQCLAGLDARGVAYRPLAMPAATGRCGIANAVRLVTAEAALSRPADMTCALAARLDDFLREVVEPAALRYFGRRVSVIQHYGSFACRAESDGRHRLSQHAFGRAIDIAGF